MNDFDICIASRGHEMGLWMTISSCEFELSKWDYDYKYHIVHNGEPELDWATKMLLENLEKTGHLGSSTVIPEPVSPPSARNMAAAKGTAPVLFFFDNHIMVEPCYFTHALLTMQDTGADSVHSVTKFWAGAKTAYHYRFTLEKNFWGYQVNEPVNYFNPYRIAAGAHGGYAITRSCWEELGGYWDGFVGYGGEESYFELMMGMRDKVTYLDPKMVHWHHPGTRPYEREKSTDFIKNMLACANIVGGPMWVRRVYNGLLIRERKVEQRNIDFESLFVDAIKKSDEFASEFQRKAKRTLNEQLVYFSRQGCAL